MDFAVFSPAKTPDYGKVSNLTLEDGQLPTYAWPGCYQILYAARIGDVYCADCAQTALFGANEDKYSQDFDDPVEHWFIYYEGPTMNCAGCNKELESEYGDPLEDDDVEQELSEDDE